MASTELATENYLVVDIPAVLTHVSHNYYWFCYHGSQCLARHLDGYRTHMQVRYSNAEVFEKSTGVRLPPFIVTEYDHGYVCFNGDFEDSLTIEFDNPPSDDFYQYLDSLVEVSDGWTKSTSTPVGGVPDGVYIIINDSVVYKNNTGGADQYLYIYIKKGETKATISYGRF